MKYFDLSWNELEIERIYIISKCPYGTVYRVGDKIRLSYIKQGGHKNPIPVLENHTMGGWTKFSEISPHIWDQLYHMTFEWMPPAQVVIDDSRNIIKEYEEYLIQKQERSK